MVEPSGSGRRASGGDARKVQSRGEGEGRGARGDLEPEGRHRRAEEVAGEGSARESGYNDPPRSVQAASKRMKNDLRDFTLRALILVAGGLSALVLALQGHGEALPAIAIGGAVGAFFATRVQQTSQE